MKKCFVFCHGFGFNKTFWQNLIPYFSTELCLYIDLGYLDNEFFPAISPSSDLEFVGIGHSLGLVKLLNCNIKFKYLVGLNGFINFLGSKQKLRTEREIMLNKLLDSLSKWPIRTMRSFYKNCGMTVENEKINKLKKKVLLKDLEMLFSNFSLPVGISVLIIAAKDDAIVPPSIIYDNFQGNTAISLLNNGSHGLGFFEADKIFSKISSFIK